MGTLHSPVLLDWVAFIMQTIANARPGTVSHPLPGRQLPDGPCQAEPAIEARSLTSMPFLGATLG
jgi:hypothetical protein